MIALNHALTGAAIGLALRQPALVIPAAFASHFVLDMIPHFGHKRYVYGDRVGMSIFAVDGLLTIAGPLALALWAPYLLLPVLLGAFFAILPDLFWIYFYKRGQPKHWFFDFHQGIQWFERPAGALVEFSYLIFIVTFVVAIK